MNNNIVNYISKTELPQPPTSENALSSLPNTLLSFNPRLCSLDQNVLAKRLFHDVNETDKRISNRPTLLDYYMALSHKNWELPNPRI